VDAYREAGAAACDAIMSTRQGRQSSSAPAAAAALAESQRLDEDLETEAEGASQDLADRKVNASGLSFARKRDRDSGSRSRNAQSDQLAAIIAEEHEARLAQIEEMRRQHNEELALRHTELDREAELRHRALEVELQRTANEARPLELRQVEL